MLVPHFRKNHYTKLFAMAAFTTCFAYFYNVDNFALAGDIHPQRELWGVLSTAGSGSLYEASGGAESVSTEALPGNSEASSTAQLTAGNGLPKLKVFANGASGQFAQAEAVQKYRFNSSMSGDVVVNASFSAKVNLDAQFGGLIAMFTEDGFQPNAEAEIAVQFGNGEMSAIFGDSIITRDLDAGSSSMSGTINLSIETNLEPGEVFWVYALFEGRAFEGEIDGFSTATLSFTDSSNITLLGSVVPEPASIAMLGIAAVMLLGRSVVR